MSIKTIPPVVTARWLKRIGACSEQVEVFQRLYPDGVGTISAAIVRRLVRLDVDVEWLAARFGLGHDGDELICLACTSDPAGLARYLRSKQRKAP